MSIGTVISILTWLAPGVRIWGLSFSQIGLLLPKIAIAYGALDGVIKALTGKGIDPMTAVGNTMLMVAKVHKMTPDEEMIWMNRTTAMSKDNS